MGAEEQIWELLNRVKTEAYERGVKVGREYPLVSRLKKERELGFEAGKAHNDARIRDLCDQLTQAREDAAKGIAEVLKSRAKCVYDARQSGFVDGILAEREEVAKFFDRDFRSAAADIREGKHLRPQSPKVSEPRNGSGQVTPENTFQRFRTQHWTSTPSEDLLAFYIGVTGKPKPRAAFFDHGNSKACEPKGTHKPMQTRLCRGCKGDGYMHVYDRFVVSDTGAPLCSTRPCAVCKGSGTEVLRG